MLRTILNSVLCGFLAAILAGSALAHHGWTGYDEQKTLTLTGVIRESSWENPHGLIRLQGDEGKGKTWLVYLAPPSRMESRGLPKDAIKVGATVTVVGYPNKTNPDEMRAERITVGGKTTELR
ncbi:MAG: hypothetical protein JWO19_3517 [Bryobacterales bacterium]|jgi:hypothetical protein|nr:hypothetical protein [Bryobacterales bacterium]